MCAFCWAFRPTWASIQAELAQDKTRPIQIVSLLGGLAPDSDEPMPTEMQTKISGIWRYIEEKIPGTRFNHDYWQKQQARRSTYPSCRAVMAAKMLDTQLEDRMTLAVQQAYYLNALNPSNDDTLIDCAVSIGLNKTAFIEQYQSHACDLAFQEEMAQCRSLGINSFPSLVLSKDTLRFNIPIDYNHASKVLNDIRQVNAHLDA